MDEILNKRARILTEEEYQGGAVMYWMSRDQRVEDNWAFLFAQNLALSYQVPLTVVFCLTDKFLGASYRQYDFMIKGLKEVEENLRHKNIVFRLLIGEPDKKVPEFIKKEKIGILITDFNPLRIKMEWEKKIAKAVKIPFYQVDAHNIVPCWVASSKQEFAARTIRPKINALLAEYLVEFPKVKKHPYGNNETPAINWDKILEKIKLDHKVAPVAWLKPGEKEAKEAMNNFIKSGLKSYDANRNDPTLDGQSNLSPYLHFGQLSAARVALEAQKSSAQAKNKEAFLEELIIRLELADNFCFYNPHYDSVSGFPAWARKTLKEHAKDKRKYRYSLKQLDKAQTHDKLWNAAQEELVNRGKMHGYMRMYWAKKILEWTKNPKIALKYAIYLNDRYELDGRDPDGYVGVAWSIGGVHDRPWRNTPIFGNIRYMSESGCKRKFNVEKYIQKQNRK